MKIIEQVMVLRAIEEVYRGIGNCATAKILSDAADTIERLSERIQELSCDDGWIPCSKRLPRYQDELVLIQVSGQPKENTTLENALELAVYDKKDGWILESFPEWEGAEPVAWQPLPKLYGGEE